MTHYIIIVLLSLSYLTIAMISTRLILHNYKLSKKLKLVQLSVTWGIPLIGGLLLILFNKKDKPVGSHIDKEPSWKRLIKYDENGEA